MGKLIQEFRQNYLVNKCSHSAFPNYPGCTTHQTRFFWRFLHVSVSFLFFEDSLLPTSFLQEVVVFLFPVALFLVFLLFVWLYFYLFTLKVTSWFKTFLKIIFLVYIGFCKRQIISLFSIFTIHMRNSVFHALKVEIFCRLLDECFWIVKILLATLFNFTSQKETILNWKSK